MPGPWSRTVTSPSATPTSISPPGGLHLTALSSRLAIGALEAARHAATDSCRSVERDLGREPPRPVDRFLRQHVELDVGRLEVGPLARELDEVRDEQAHLLELADDVAEQRLALLVREVAPAGEHLDVRAQARQRRPQLVRGVRDELALRALRLLERGQHRVEARAEPASSSVPCTRSGERDPASP